MTLGNLDRAAALLNELAMHRALQRDLVIFRIRLASLRGEHAEVIELCEEHGITLVAFTHEEELDLDVVRLRLLEAVNRQTK